VYLASPEAAVAAALKGEICDPVEYFKYTPYPKIDIAEKFIIDDSMGLPPSANPSSVEIFRGPNIGAPPSNEACPDTINGSVTIKVGEKITTDHIMPAGSRLKYRPNIQKYAEFVFEREDPQFAKRALGNKEKGVHNIIVAGESYGQGSSREHAAICPMYLGVKMVIAVSMERIHRANLVNFGIIPALFENAADYEQINRDDVLTISDVRKCIESGSILTAVRKNDNLTIKLKVELTEREKGMILAGGLINQCKMGGEK
jgi:aconitate hydratase